MTKRSKTVLPEPRCALPGLMDFIKGEDESQEQRAWETAMGMRGYAGSPAQKADREQKKFKRTLTCGHTITVTFKKNAHYCESCHARRRPIAAADEE